MAFIEKSDPVVLNIKLTTKGRELLSTGNLNFKYFAIGDSEIDYGFTNAVHASDANFTAFNSNILRPADNNPSIISFIPRNLSGDPYNVITSIPTTWYPVTNTMESIGFFTNSGTTFINDSNHVKQPDAMVYMNTVTGGNQLTLKKSPAYGTSGEEPQIGDFVLVKWTLNGNTVTGYAVDKNTPTPYLMYRISGITGTLGADNLVVTVDRNIPDFTGHNPTGIAGAMIFYNQLDYSGNTTILSELSTDYLDESVTSFLENSQCPTIIFPFWNMSIVFTEEIAGVQASLSNAKYTQFKTRGFGGFVSYIQSQQSFYKKLGIIHYTNQSPANVYAEGFYQDTPKLEIPTIMWHKSAEKKMGLTLKAGSGYTLVDLDIHYYDLIDANNPDYVVVGKIFDELKMFLIEDQELLFAMSYKSNRSWTLPSYDLTTGGNLVAPPEPPQTLFVQTLIGTPGSIKGTGGFNIIGYEKITEYGVEYKLASLPDVPANWTRITRTGSLTVNNFTIDIEDTLPSTAYNYRSFVKMGKNEYIDKNTYTITTLAPPAPPVPPPPVIVPSVNTKLGTAGIGKIDNTGGESIPTNVGVAIEKYGMEYKQSNEADIAANWKLSPATALNGPILGTGFQHNITGLAQSTSYDYRAYIQVAGVKYVSGSWQTNITAAEPAPVVYVPQVTTGVAFKQLSNTTTQSIDVITKSNAITDSGGTTITRYGVLYTDSSSFSTADKLTYNNVGPAVRMSFVDGSTSVAFTTNLTGLADSSPFWFRAFAINSAGIGYGDIANGTTIPLYVAPPTASLVYIDTPTQTSTNLMVTSSLSAKIGLSKPLEAGQSIILNVTTCGLSDTVTSPNEALLWNIRTCAYYTVGSSTVKNILAATDISLGVETTCRNENYGTITLTSANINTICLRANAYSASKNAALIYTNKSIFKINSIQNVGGANYSLGGNIMTAANSTDDEFIYSGTKPLLER